MVSSPQSRLKVVHVASEIAAIAKVGGLGDVVYGLARATAKAGHDVEVWLPKYDQIKLELTQKSGPLWTAEFHGIHLVFVDVPGYFNRGKIYGCPDDVDRFVHFCHLVSQSLEPPDILHLHDWPTSLMAPLARQQKWNSRTILTIHNMEHQGRCLRQQIAFTGLNDAEMLDPRDPEKDLNLLMGGIAYSDWAVAVSPTYLSEVLTPGRGHGLDAFLHKQQSKMRGILNGIDTSYWDPSSDHLVPHPYTSLEGKRENKRLLRQRLKLKEDDSPLVAVITRLVHQKGPELIEYGLRYTLKQGGQFVLLGSSPHPSIQNHFEMLKREVDGPHAALCLEYNEPLSHQLYAAADMFFIPSIFEPCGLTQMIALRYGAVPVVRATGGLKDTVADHQNGFTFESPNRGGVEQALGKAFETYRKNPQAWKKLIERGMSQDFSWQHAAKNYFELYTISIPR